MLEITRNCIAALRQSRLSRPRACPSRSSRQPKGRERRDDFLHRSCRGARPDRHPRRNEEDRTSASSAAARPAAALEAGGPELVRRLPDGHCDAGLGRAMARPAAAGRTHLRPHCCACACHGVCRHAGAHTGIPTLAAALARISHGWSAADAAGVQWVRRSGSIGGRAAGLAGRPVTRLVGGERRRERLAGMVERPRTILRETFPEYAPYAARTQRLIPGVY